MMTDNVRNVFISHVHEDDDGLNNLKDLLTSNGIVMRDYSINSDNPNNAHSEEYIKSEILAPRIRQCPTLVVYVSPETRKSKYVDWEIEYAHKHDKRIVGIWAYGENGCEVPDALKKYSDAVVGWKGSRIIDAITGKLDGWENPDGSSASEHDIDRYKCR